MATKFVRVDDDGRGRAHVYWQMPRIRQRLVIIYGGVSFVALLLIVHIALTRANSSHRPEVIEAPATIVAKSAEAGSSEQRLLRVDLEVAVDGGRTEPAFLYTDAASWRALEPGDQVSVNYQTGSPESPIRIVSMATTAH